MQSAVKTHLVEIKKLKQMVTKTLIEIEHLKKKTFKLAHTEVEVHLDKIEQLK